MDGKPVDDAAEVTLTASTNGAVRGPAELGELLSRSPEVAACFVRQWFRYAYGRDDDDTAISCAAQDVAIAFDESGRSARGMLRAFTQHDSFTQRAEVP